VFAAALRQSEELFDAAKAVSAAAKPLPLFYGLSQAGRAITAARDQDAGWKSYGHGLKVGEDSVDIGRSTITADGGGKGLFGGFTRALGSDGIEGKVELSSVWASIPELAHLPNLRRRALGVLPLQPEGGGEPVALSVLHAARASALIVGLTPEADIDDHLNRFGRVRVKGANNRVAPSWRRVWGGSARWPSRFSTSRSGR
jgi:hypothetical protein